MLGQPLFHTPTVCSCICHVHHLGTMAVDMVWLHLPGIVSEGASTG